MPGLAFLLTCLALFGGAESLTSQSDDVKRHRTFDCIPKEIHLALSESTDELRLVWVTTADGCEATVSYGPMYVTNGSMSASLLSKRAFSEEYVLRDTQTCNGRARQSAFYKNFHTALLTGLETGAMYQYQIKGSDELYSFVANPDKGARARMTFAVYGDMGETKRRARKNPMAEATLQAVLESHRQNPLDLLLHVGDLSYGDGRHESWDSFMEMIEPLAAEVPYMVIVGNHEYDYWDGQGEGASGSRNDASGALQPYHPDWGNYGEESGGECGVMTAKHFLMPAGNSNKQAAARKPSVQTRTRHAVPSTDNPKPAAGGDAFGTAMRLGAAKLAALMRMLEGGSRQSNFGRKLGLSGGKRSALLSSSDQQEAHQLRAPDASGTLDSVGYFGPTDNPPFWYSFDYGIVHFTVVSTEHDLSPGSLQYEWLQADLSSVDRCSTPWLMVAMHRPMYVVYPHKSNRDVGEHLRDFLEDLLLEYKVDAVLSGHVHSYYRSCSVVRETCTDDNSGIVHLVIGTGGHVLSGVEDQQRLWCRSAAVDHGFGLFNIHGESLKFSFVRSIDNQLVDETKMWAKVSRRDCDSFMSSRRLAGVQRSPEATAAADAERSAAAVLRSVAYAEGARENDALWHVIEGPGLSPAGSLPEDDVPEPDYE